MLGSLSEADDAVQDAWLRLSRADPTSVENLGGWLTTVVARVCLNMLRSRGQRNRSTSPMIERFPAAARQLASRARRRVQDQARAPDPDLTHQRAVVDAFFAASRDGDFDALVAVLDPEVVLRSDGGTTRRRLTFVMRGARAVAGQALTSRGLSPLVRPALVNGAAGVVVAAHGRPLFVMAFTVAGGKIHAFDVLADPERVHRFDLTDLDG
jgi:ketosteroid isomerase-like protein